MGIKSGVVNLLQNKTGTSYFISENQMKRHQTAMLTVPKTSLFERAFKVQTGELLWRQRQHEEENLTYRRHRQSHGHGYTDKEGRQEDLRKESLCVSLGTVEPLDDETVELTELQPPALVLEAALAFQHFCFWGRGVLCIVWHRRQIRRRETKRRY